MRLSQYCCSSWIRELEILVIDWMWSSRYGGSIYTYIILIYYLEIRLVNQLRLINYIHYGHMMVYLYLFWTIYDMYSG